MNRFERAAAKTDVVTVLGIDGVSTLEWMVPTGWIADKRVSRCRSCGREVVWCLTPKGKKAPVNIDGLNHFATCKDADRWRK